MHATLTDPPQRLTLAAAHVPACLAPGVEGSPDADGLLLLDITIEDGRFSSIDRHHPAPPDPATIDLKGRMVWPCPVDMHTHLDKGHIWPRATGLDGGFAAAIEAVQRDRHMAWGADDVRDRMEFALRCAFAHGTCAIRTHIDSMPPQAEISWPVFAELRQRWADRITLQGVALNPAEDYRGSYGEQLARLVAEHGGILGMFPEHGPQLDADLDRFLATAEAHGLDVDLHVDETGDPAAKALRHLAQAVLRRGFKGRVVAGHCCSLAVHDPDRRGAHAGPSRRGRNRRRQPADVQPLSAGPAAWPHPALARHHAGPRNQGPWHPAGLRQRQYPRPLLRLR